MRTVKLPIIGPVTIGKIEQTPVEKTVNAIIGGFFDNPNALSNEKTISKKLLEANKEWVYRNNDVIAKEVGQAEFILYSIGLSKGQIDFKEVDQHPLLDLLDRFNDSTTKSDALYTTQSHKKLTGDAFWYLDMNGQVIRNIFIYEPDKIELIIGDPTDASDRLVDGYKYKDTIDGKSIERIYRPEEFIHFKTPNPKNMFRGYGAVEAAADTIDLDNLSAETKRKYFLQGAITNFVLSTESKLTDEQIKRLRAELKNAYGGVSNAYRTMILGGGLKPEKLSYSDKEMDMIKSLEWYRDKLMVIFGNTKASLGIIDDVNRASHESAMISWKRGTISPEIKAIVDTLNEFLVPKFGKNLILGFKDPVPEDREAKLNEIEKGKSILTINERRELLGYDPVPEGDIIQEVESNRRADEMANNPPEIKVPKGLKNVNMKSVLRRNGIYKQKEMYAEAMKIAKPLAKKMLGKNKKKEAVEVAEHEQFTNEKVWAYWKKQVNIVDVHETRFKNVVEQFIDFLEETVLANLDNDIAQRKTVIKQLFVEEDLIEKADLEFTPLLMEQALLAGQQAYLLIGVDDPYIPFAIREAVRANVEKFTQSMLDTDREKLVNLITEGIKEGKSVSKIRREIQDVFVTIKRVQAERITRTEVLKTSNMAAEDAWEQSGIVESKQWLTAEDDRVDPLCAAMNGKTIQLRAKFFRKGEEFMGTKFNYSSIKEPPLHPSCRCVLLPILENQKAFEPLPIFEREIMTNKIKKLEDDARKKAPAEGQSKDSS